MDSSESSVYKTAEKKEVTPKEPQKSGDGSGIQSTDVDVPYTAYESENNHPYLVDHFKLGDTWNDKLGGFQDEVSAIEGYFKQEIQRGNIQDDVSAVKGQMNKLYKLCGIDKNERVTMQIEKLAAYIDFLKKTDHIKLNHQRYGG